MILFLFLFIIFVFIWLFLYFRIVECGGGGGGIGGGSGIVVWFFDVEDGLNEEIEGKVEVDVFGCIVVDKVLNDVVRFFVVEVVVVCFV